MKQFTDQELTVIANIIDVASQRGMFRAGDMEAVGALFKKITASLPKPETKEVESDGKK